MAGIKGTIIDAYENGKNVTSYIRKVSATASTAGLWVDLSMTTGTPTPNYYVGGEKEATIPSQWYKKGIWHGGAVSPNSKYLHKGMLLGTNAVVAPAPFLLCDYLLYYPLIDMDSTDEQPFDNPITLSRYQDGMGVQAMLVATNPYVGGARFTMMYTNQAGQSGRISQVILTNTGTNIGTIVNSNTAGPNNMGAFIPLQVGDIGIRSVQSITFRSPNGGLASLVLVKPIATLMTKETTAWAEFDFIKDKPSLPKIYDDAYLNFITMASGSIATIPILGELSFIWN